MNPAKDIFLEAARKGQAVFIPVHIERIMLETPPISLTDTRVKELSIEAAEALKNKVPSLITTLRSKRLIKAGKIDVVARNKNFSAVNNPKHKKFLERNDTSVALISGVSAGLCVSFTIADCKKQSIIPVAIMDAINLPIEAPRTTPENYELFKQSAASMWSPDILTASTDEVVTWAQEL